MNIKQRWIKRMVACLMLVVMLVPCFASTANAEFQVTPSTVDYSVTMKKSSNFFLYNKETLGSAVGTEYYMTYTVESIEAEKFVQQGMLGCNDPTRAWPYEYSKKTGKGGYMNYSRGDTLLKEGYTYFFKFTITEDGYDYKAAWAKEDESSYIKFGSKIGKVKTGLEYFGIWFGDTKLTGKLIRVRFYDKKGTDLGLKATSGKGVAIGREEPYKKDTKVGHSYTVTISNAYNIALGNKRKPTSNKVYIEYKVEKSAGTRTWQNGVILGNNPTANYPYETGFMQYGRYEKNLEKADAGPLLVEGAEYLMIFEKREKELDITIQRTLKGETTYIVFPYPYKTYSQDDEFFSLWFGDGTEYKVNAVLTNFKCYDSNKNNLGVQSNRSCQIIHYGELEDYAGCESLYYSDELNEIFALYKDKTLKHTANGNTNAGTYRIEEAMMETNIQGVKENYDYRFLYFTDENENVYDRLRTYKVTFDTGEGSAVEEQVLNADNGYMVMRPTDPTLEGNTFEGWYTKEGEEYQFGNISSQSLTLYAKWKDVSYTAQVLEGEIPQVLYVSFGVGILIVAASIVGGIFIVRRKKKDADSN